MKKIVVSIALSLLLLGGILAGCGPKTYDMSAISVSPLVVEYDGAAKSVSYQGELPQGVNATVKYYADQEYATEVENPTDAGTYYVKFSFAGEEGSNPIDDKTTTLTITKANFGNVDFQIRGNCGGGVHSCRAI